MKQQRLCVGILSRHARVMAFLSSSLAGVCFVVARTLVQAIHIDAERNITAYQMVLISSILQLVVISIIMAWRSVAPFSEWRDIPYLLIMGGAEAGAIFSLYVGLELIPIGDATAVLFVKPVFTFIFSYLLLKEHCSWMDIMAGFVSFLGVLIMTRPSLNEVSSQPAMPVDILSENPLLYGSDGSDRYLHGMAIVLVSAILISLYYGMNKWSGRAFDVTLPVFYPSLIGTLLMTGTTLSGLKDPAFFHMFSTSTWIALFWISFLSFFGYMLMAEAFQLEAATPIVIVRNLDVVYAFVLQIIVIGITPSWSSLIGGGMIVLSSGFITFRRFWMAEDSRQ